MFFHCNVPHCVLTPASGAEKWEADLKEEEESDDRMMRQEGKTVGSIPAGEKKSLLVLTGEDGFCVPAMGGETISLKQELEMRRGLETK